MNPHEVLADQEAKRQKYRGDISEFFRYAARHAKKSPLEIVKEFWHLARGDGRLSLSDYFLYRLFDDRRFSMADKQTFISDELHWPISGRCNDPSWKGLTEDKWISYKFMGACGIPTPTTLAVIDTTKREFSHTPKITNPSELRQFLLTQADFPLFVKSNTGMGSFGAFVIAGVDNNLIIREHAEPISCAAVFSEVVGKYTYLIQTFIRNHRDIEPLSPYCATIRTINMVRSGTSVLTPRALIKIPGRSSIADNYWRDGNVIANIELETGIISRAVIGKGISMKELSEHPDTKEPLIGRTIPFWKELRALNEACALLYAPVRYNSLDIAVTNDGPAVIEINTGGGFDLPQLASGKGLLTDEVREFFASCGWKFKRKTARSI
jgi:hypothetical protein